MNPFAMSIRFGIVTRMRFTFPLLLLLLTGCAAKQSVHDGMYELCQAPTKCDGCATGDGDQRAALYSAYIAEHVTNKDATDVLMETARIGADVKAAYLVQAAKKAGVETCPFAELYVLEPAAAPAAAPVAAPVAAPSTP